MVELPGQATLEDWNLIHSTTHRFEARLLAELAETRQVPARKPASEITNEADILDRTLSAATRALAATGFEIFRPQAA
jgi:hypothetical protein